MGKIINTLLPDQESVKIIDIDTSKIIDLYKSQYKYDASRHFETINIVSIYQCLKTGFRFYYPLSIEGDDQFYSELYSNHYKDFYTNNKWEFRQAMNYVEKGMRVLDIGCGGGDFLNNVRNEKGAEVFALEKSSFAISLLREKNIAFFNQTLQEFAATTTERFDIVCAFQVLEHVGQLGQFIESAVKLLKPNGKLIIGVPNSNPYIYKKELFHTLNLPPHHMDLWDKNALINLAPYFNLVNKTVLIEPLDSVLYYLMTQMGIQRLYWKMHAKPFTNFIAKCFKYTLQPFKSLFEGRGILGIYELKQN
jgi:2-polyprenyl-3-methyl-5-hydroxy-6-metoxy-1,4-benzoquinol methylase